MDKEALVSALKTLRKEIARKEGPLNLFVLYSAEATPFPSWNLIVSSVKLDQKSRAEGITEINDLLRDQDSAALANAIVRLTVLPTSDPFVQAFNSAFPARNHVLDLVGTQVSGFDFARAIVVDSQRNAA